MMCLVDYKIKKRVSVQVKEVVTVVNSTDRNELYTLFINAARGDFVEVVTGKDKHEINKLEDLFKKTFDTFATTAFNMGREYGK